MDRVKRGLAQHEMRVFMVLVFTIGTILGTALAILYVLFVTNSPAKYFHAFVMLAGAGFTGPAFMLSLRLMLRMYDQSLEALENQNYLIAKWHEKEDKFDPMIDKAQKIITNLDTTVEKLTAKGDLEKSLEAVRAIPGKLDALIKVAKQPAAKGDITVPTIRGGVTDDPGL